MPGDRLVAGVDGCPCGWIAAVGRVDASLVFLAAADDFGWLLDRFRGVTRWAIDMPIGLSDDCRRECDVLARKRLGGRASTLFFAPPRLVLGAETYAEACQGAEASTGKRLSKQTWNLVPKIREVRRALLDRPSDRKRAFESHPELCFAQMNGGVPIAEPKKSDRGEAARRKLIAGEIGAEAVDRLIAEASAMSSVGRDDALDALACWTAARRSALDQHTTLPAAPATDPNGLPLAISW